MSRPTNYTQSPYSYEELKARQRALGPTGPDGPISAHPPGDEPDYDAEALEPEEDTDPFADLPTVSATGEKDPFADVDPFADLSPATQGAVVKKGVLDHVIGGAKVVGAVAKALPGAIIESAKAPWTASKAIERYSTLKGEHGITGIKRRKPGLIAQAEADSVRGINPELPATLRKEAEEQKKKFIGGTAETLANVVTLPIGGGAVAGIAKAGGKALLVATAKTAAIGAGAGAAYGAVHGATEATLEGKSAGEIYQQSVKEAADPVQLILGGVLGGVAHVAGAGISKAVGAGRAARTAAQEVAEKIAKQKQEAGLQEFINTFDPAEFANVSRERAEAAARPHIAQGNIVLSPGGERAVFPDPAQAAAFVAQQNANLAKMATPEQIAIDIIRGTHGELADTKAGMRAASQLLTRTQAIEPHTIPGLETPSGSLTPTLPFPDPAIAPGVGGLAPQPNVIGEYKPTMDPTFVPPQGPIEALPGMQQVGAEVPAPAAPPLVLEGVQPLRGEGAPTPQLGPNLGPVEQGGRPLPPAPEIAPRILDAPAAPEAVAVPAAEIAPSGSAPEPNPVRLPTHADNAIAALGKNEHVTLGTDAEGKHLTIEKLGVTPGALAKPGASSDALAHVSAVADEHGLPIEAHITPQAGPRGGKIPLEKLLLWYEEHGYTITSQGEGWATVRRAPSMPAIAERVAGLGPAEAKLAAGNVQLGNPMVHASFGERLGKVLNSAADDARARIKSRGTRLSAGLDPTDLADHSIVLAAEMFTRGMRTKAAITSWLIEKYGVDIKPHIEAIYAGAQKRLTTMFKSDARANTKLKELVELRESGAHGMDWYEETATWVKKNYDPEDADMFLKFLAATSADGSTEGGSALAMKAFAQWKQGMPFDGSRGPHMVGMFNDAVQGKQFGGDKVYSFYQALRGDKDAVVLDHWMIRALGLPASRSSLSAPDYKLYSAIVRNLATDANMSPRQLQAAIWEGSRIGSLHKRWKEGGRAAASKVGSARPLEDLLQREFNGMTPYQWIEQNKITHETLGRQYDGLRTARKTGGYTFDPKDWKKDTTPGYLVTLVSDSVPQDKFYPAALTQFANRLKSIVGDSGGAHVSIGAFDMKDYKAGHFSLDLNVVIPNNGPESLALAKRLGKSNRQHEIGEVNDVGDYVQGHKTGYNPKKDGPQHLPPKSSAARNAWFKKAIGKARTTIDQVQFTMR